MSRSYARIPMPHGERKAAKTTAAPKAKNMRADFKGEHSPEQLSLFFQMFIAQLQQKGVTSVGQCSFYFAPLGKKGERIYLVNEDGEPLEVMTIGFKKPAEQKAGFPELALSFGLQRPRSFRNAEPNSAFCSLSGMHRLTERSFIQFDNGRPGKNTSQTQIRFMRIGFLTQLFVSAASNRFGC